MLNLKRSVRQLRSAEGAEIAEAALVLPLAFMLLLGIVWFGRAFNIYATIQQAAQQGAITAARASCVTCGNAPATAAAVDNTISAVLLASNLNPAQVTASTSPGLPGCPLPAPPGGTCTATNEIWICSNVWLNSASATQPPQCGAVVSFQYPFQFYLPFTSLNMQQIILSAQAQSRMEN